MSARLARTDPAGRAAAARVVRLGGVLLYPTETVYGLGGDPEREDVLARIRALKGREGGRPMLVLTDDWARVRGWLGQVTDLHERLMAHEPPLPVTLLFEPSAEAPGALVGPEGWIGLRRTSDPFCRAVIAEAGRPFLSTSANPAGEPPPHRFADVDAGLLGAVDLAVDAGAPLAGVPSTVVRVAGGEIEVVREGAVSRARLIAVAGGDG